MPHHIVRFYTSKHNKYIKTVRGTDVTHARELPSVDSTKERVEISFPDQNDLKCFLSA